MGEYFNPICILCPNPIFVLVVHFQLCIKHNIERQVNLLLSKLFENMNLMLHRYIPFCCLIILCFFLYIMRFSNGCEPLFASGGSPSVIHVIFDSLFPPFRNESLPFFILWIDGYICACRAIWKTRKRGQKASR